MIEAIPFYDSMQNYSSMRKWKSQLPLERNIPHYIRLIQQVIYHCVFLPFQCFRTLMFASTDINNGEGQHCYWGGANNGLGLAHIIWLTTPRWTITGSGYHGSLICCTALTGNGWPTRLVLYRQHCHPIGLWITLRIRVILSNNGTIYIF